MALLKVVMAEEEERSEIKGRTPLASTDGKQRMSGSSTLSSDDEHSLGEATDANMAAAGVEGLVLGEGERRRELTPAASDTSSNGGDDDKTDDVALSSLIRCLFLHNPSIVQIVLAMKIKHECMWLDLP